MEKGLGCGSVPHKLYSVVFSGGINWWRTWFGLHNMELNRLVSRAWTRL